MKREGLYIRVPSKKDGTYDFIKTLGGDPEAIARAAGFKPPSAKDKIRFVPWADLCRFFELAAETLDEPYFGLKWAMSIPEDLRNIGPTIYMKLISKNLRHFIDMMLPYLEVHTNGVAFSYEEDIEANTVTGICVIHPMSPPCRQYCEHILAIAAEMGRRYVPDLKLHSVTFQYSEPEDMSWYEKAFKCPVYFNADHNTMVTDRVYLDVEKTPQILKVTKPLLKTYLNWNAEKPPQSTNPISQLIISTLPLIMGANNSDITALANALELHPKKLQRLLADEGISYSEIIDDVRVNLATRLLGETDISIDRIAKTLDYSSDRAFTTASKRWFGMTPTKYRNHIRLID